MARKIVDFWVGLFVLIGFAALLFLALKAGNMSSFSTNASYTIQAKFDNIGGLKPRAPVKSAGVVVGRVGEIKFDDQSFQAIVSLNMDARYAFPKDTSAKILTSGLLGEQYIGLSAGGDVDNLQAGDKLKLTQSAVVLEDLISQVLYIKAADSGSDNSGSSASDKK